MKALADLIAHSRKTVFFGGAGTSTESGIPDFRSSDGLYHQKWAYPPETILSHSFWEAHPETFYRFYREKMLFPDAQPNKAHRSLARLENAGLLYAVVTQNIDDLHQKAGSRNVIELHGTVMKNHCVRCRRGYGLNTILSTKGIPVCECGGIIKPDVVLYEESLPDEAVQAAVSAIETAELLIIGGTSLTVYPAAGFVRLCPGKIAVINKSPTQMDQRADVLISESIGETLDEICKELLKV